MAKILIMEDDHDFAELLTASLEGEGHQVVWCPDGTSAIQYFQNNQVDLVITDLSIKRGGQRVSDGGISLIGQIRQLDRDGAKTLPVIAITGSHVYRGMSHILDTAAQVGANAALKKPFEPDELIFMIKRLLG